MIFDVRSTSDGGFTARQSQQTPALYLDICAIRAIAERPKVAERFVQAMRRTSASLLVSSMTIYEFSVLNDPRHAKAVDELLRQLFRHLYFIQCEPFTVIAREDAMLGGVAISAPHADAEMFKQTLILVSQQQGGFQLTTIFSAHSTELRPVLDEFGQKVREAFQILQVRVNNDPELRRNAGQAFAKIGNRQTATAALLVTLVKPLHEDRLPTENDMIDLMHTVVPSAYAELVVLDGKWASAVSQATKRMRAAGYSAPVARPFSMRRNGLEEFLSALESWPTKQNGGTPLPGG